MVSLIHPVGCNGISEGQSVSSPGPRLAKGSEIRIALGDNACHAHQQDQDLLDTHGSERMDVDPQTVVPIPHGIRQPTKLCRL